MPGRVSRRGAWGQPRTATAVDEDRRRRQGGEEQDPGDGETGGSSSPSHSGCWARLCHQLRTAGPLSSTLATKPAAETRRRAGRIRRRRGWTSGPPRRRRRLRHRRATSEAIDGPAGRRRAGRPRREREREVDAGPSIVASPTTTWPPPRGPPGPGSGTRRGRRRSGRCSSANPRIGVEGRLRLA